LGEEEAEVLIWAVDVAVEATEEEDSACSMEAFSVAPARVDAFLCSTAVTDEALAEVWAWVSEVDVLGEFVCWALYSFLRWLRPLVRAVLLVEAADVAWEPWVLVPDAAVEAL
jgi:hypothetical protein